MPLRPASLPITAKQTASIPLAILALALASSAAAAPAGGPIPRPPVPPPPGSGPVVEAPALREPGRGVLSRVIEGPDADGPPPQPFLAEDVAVNIDFASRAIFGTTSYHAVAHDPLRQRLYVGLQGSFAILNVVDDARPTLMGYLDTPYAINGIAHVTGNYVYATTLNPGLLVIDVSNPASPVQVASMSLGSAFDLQAVSPLLYVATFSGLRIVNISTPASPTLVGTLPGACYDVAVTGNLAYLAAYNQGLQTVDVSNPASPLLLDTDTSAWAYALSLNATATRLCLVDVNDGVRLFSLTAPANPLLLGSLSFLTSCFDVAISGSYAYVAGGNSGMLHIVDVTGGTPVLTANYDDPSYPMGLALAGNKLYGGSYYTVEVTNITNPTVPSLLGAFDSPGFVRSTALQGGYAYYACSAGLYVVDVSYLSRPRVVGRNQLNGLSSLAVSGNLCIATGGGIRLFDVSNPAAPTLVSTIPSSAPVKVALSGSLAYVAEFSGGVRIFDVSVPASPVLRATITTVGWATAVRVVGNLLYVGEDIGRMDIYDVANPASPLLVGTYRGPIARIEQIDVAGDLAFLATYTPSKSLQIVDVSIPSNPTWLSELSTISGGRDVVSVGSLAYHATDPGVAVLDASNPFAPYEAASFKPDGSGTSHVTFRGGYAYTCHDNAGAFIVHYVGQCNDDFEPNDEIAKAWPVASGSVSSGKICEPADRDYFRLDPPGGGTLQLSMAPPVGKNYDLFLYDAAGNLLASSLQAGDAPESIARSVTSPGRYHALVRGSDGTQYSSGATYALVYQFTACPAPALPVYIYVATLDVNGNVVLHVQDPNPGNVTGYDLYRSTIPTGPFALRMQNAKDMDQGLANIQLTDVGSNVGGPYYYVVKAFNGTCGAEGP